MGKTTLAFVLTVVGAIGLATNSAATAQQAGPSYDPGNPAVVAQQSPEMVPLGAVNGYSGAPGTAGTGMPVSQTKPPEPTGNEAALIDNGLWEGATVGPGCAICGGGSNAPPPDWYIRQDVKVLLRSATSHEGISFAFSGTTSTSVGTETMSTDDVAPNISGVWGMTIGHYFARDTCNRDHFVEFSFWGLNNWHDEASVDGNRLSVYNSDSQKTAEHGNLYSGYAITRARDSTTGYYLPVLNGIIMPGFDEADQQSIAYKSATNNFEVNGRFTPRGREDRMVLQPNGRWRRECQPGVFASYLYGVRFFQLNETFNFHSVGRTDIYDPTTGQLIDSTTYVGNYDVMTHNNLLGLQIGVDLTSRHCRWDWGLGAKVGPYINFCDQVSNVVSGEEYTPDYVHRLSASKHSSSLIAEAGLHASYKFRPNLVGRASYDFLWVQNVALAPEQLQFQRNPVNEIASNGHFFAHGATLGLEWLW
jgi:hypothetical protein